MPSLDTLQLFALGSALAWASGWRATLPPFLIGAAALLGWVVLPAALAPLASPFGVGVTGLLAGFGFIGDKIPGFDSLADFAATPVRMAMGALLATSMVGFDHGTFSALAATGGALLAAMSHLTKLTTRAAINASPEPFSNIRASLTEEAASVAGLWLAVAHPLVFFLLLAVTLVLMVWLIRLCVRFVRGLFGRMVRMFSGRLPPAPAPGASAPAPRSSPTPGASPALADMGDIVDVEPVAPRRPKS